VEASEHSALRRLGGRARRWWKRSRFFWRESAGSEQLGRGLLGRMWLRVLRPALCVKVIVPVKSLRRAALPVWTAATGKVFVSHWCDLLVLGEIYRAPGEYDFASLPAAAGTIVDLGANIGLSARYLSECYPAARVIAYEPDPEIMRLAQLNLRGHPQVTLRNCAAAGSAGSMTLHRFPGGSWGTSAFITKQVVSETFLTEAVTLDSIIAELGEIDILKIDIEGAEHEVLSACKNLDRIGCIVGEIHPIPDAGAEELFASLVGHHVVEQNIRDGQGPFVALRR
jgi:FkbM family methyltransferase